MFDVLLTIGLVFGGCCSNALTLEVITSEYPPTGTLITFAQFLVVAAASLRRQLEPIPQRVPRAVAIRQTFSAVSRTGASFVLIRGPEKGLVSLFERELGSLAGLNVQSEAAKEHGDGYFTSHLKFEADGKSNEDKTFTILLVGSTMSTEQADEDIILDTSDPECPCMLRPAVATHSWNPFNFRLKSRKIPLRRYAVQVLLFLAISLLNNAAFAYRVPMPVHIIFRSGGLVVNMVMGWFIEKRRYSTLQIVSVCLVTLGVALTTLSSKQSKPHRSIPAQSMQAQSEGLASVSYTTFATGIGLLGLALVLSGALGILQDRTFDKYGRGNWEEAMFYLHALALPLFGLTSKELVAQAREISAGPTLSFSDFGGSSKSITPNSPLPYLPVQPPTLRIPAFYVPLVLNVATQLLCVAGVNRLTARMNSLTVSLILVIRKAVSLGVSVMLLGNSTGNRLLLCGAALVLIGTIGYAMGSQKRDKKKAE